MSVEVGSVVEAKISGITKFGAFADLPDGKTGMIHISEVALSYVSDINDVLKVGQTVKVKVLSVNENGKISLSIKKTLEPKKNFSKDRQQSKNRRSRREPAPQVSSPGDFEWRSSQKPASASFEDMMSKFKQTSEDKISDLKRGNESRGYSRRGNGGGRR